MTRAAASLGWQRLHVMEALTAEVSLTSTTAEEAAGKRRPLVCRDVWPVINGTFLICVHVSR